MHRSRLGDEARRPLRSISRQSSQTSAHGDSGRSRSRSPHSHSSCSSKEEMLWLDYQLAMRLQREADRPCPVEDTLDEEQIRDILGPDSDYYLPSDGDLHEVFLDDRIRTRSSSRTTPSHNSVEQQPLDDTDEEVYADEFTLSVENGDADEDTRARLSVSGDDDSDENGVDDDDDDDNGGDSSDDDDDGDEDDDGSSDSHDDEDDDDGDGNNEVQEEDNEDEGADDSDAEDLNSTRVIVHMDSDSDSSTPSVIPIDNIDIDNEQDEMETLLNSGMDRLHESLVRFREVLHDMMETYTDVDVASNSGLTESEGATDFAEVENDDSVIRSDFFGRCTICFEEMPYDPVGCLYCQQMIGCRRCVTRWYRAAERDRGFDIMGGHPPSNHKQCPLCRHQWEEQEEVTSMFLLRDDFP